MQEARSQDERFFDAIQNARLVAGAEAYYRVMYYGAAQSWNLRDQHMFQTLLQLLRFHGPESKIVVWAHNSHVGDAAATEMSARGELNIGQLCRQHFRDAAYAVGFGTDHGDCGRCVLLGRTHGGQARASLLREELRASVPRIGARVLPLAPARARRGTSCVPS